MTNKIPHLLTIAITSCLLACGDDGPSLDDGGSDGATGGPIDTPECAPFEVPMGGDEVGGEEPVYGVYMPCQGEGTGWLVTEVYGAGDKNPITGCLAYDGLEVPAEPTPEDCATLPLDVITDSFGIPSPTACCTEEALEEDIIATCENDCGFAACKVAVDAIRTTADNLVPPEGVPQGVIDTTKADLYAYADFLEMPTNLKYCATKVTNSPGEIVPLGLGSGVTSSADLGHIKDATLYLSCSLDPDEPFIVEETLACQDATNIPETQAEQEAAGVVPGGAVTVYGPDDTTVADLSGATFEFREVLNRDMSVDFTLTSFDADVAATSAGSFELSDIQISLVDPGSGKLEGEIVTFPAGTLRFAVTASVAVDGEPLFEGAPTTAEYTNSAPAIAIRGLDGSFAFVDATFEVGDYTAVLNTEPAPFEPLQ